MSTFSQHNWRYDEVHELLSIRAEDDIVSQVSGTARDAVVYEQITSRLRGRGIYRTKSQVTNKLKALKRQFLQIVNNGQNEDESKGWPFFSLCDTVWRSGQLTTAVPGSKKPPTITRCPETQPVCETDVSADESDSSTGATYLSIINITLYLGITLDKMSHSLPEWVHINHVK